MINQRKQRRRHPHRLGVVAVFAAIALDTSLAVAESPPAPGAGVAQAGVAQNVPSFRSLLEDESGRTAGARQTLMGASVHAISVTGIMDAVIAHNIDVATARVDTTRATARGDQANAAFDPRLSIAVLDSRSLTNDRTASITRMRDPSPTELLGEDGGATPAATADTDNAAPTTGSTTIGCITIDGTFVDPTTIQNFDVSRCSLSPAISTSLEYASYFNNQRVVPYTTTYRVGLEQPFPFGGAASLNLDTLRHIKNTYGPLGRSEYQGGTVANPFGWGNRMPWTSNLSATISVPLPFTKNFGTDGSAANLEMYLADSDQRASSAQESAIRNKSLEQGLLAYLNLVLARGQITALAPHRKILEAKLASMQRRFNAGQVTIYSLKQVETEVENLRDREEIAWGDYAQASNAIRRQLAVKENTVFIPESDDPSAAVHLPLQKIEKFLAEGASEKLLTEHPEVKVVGEQFDASKANTRFRENQTLPDISLSVSYALNQVDNVYGYKSSGDALGHVFTPDRTDLAILLRYVVPLSDADEARASHAHFSESQLHNTLQQTSNHLLSQMEVALKEIRSSEAMIERTGTDLHLAQLAVDKGAKLSESNLISQFEYLGLYDDLLTARLSNISARINGAKGTVRYLASRGILEKVMKDGDL